MILLTLLLCFCLMMGGTFALFTVQDKSNIVISSGKVDVVATLGDLQTSSLGATQEGGAFVNGGKASIVDDTIKLEKVTPGDKATFVISIANNSDIAIQWQTAFEVVSDTGLFESLVVTIDDVQFDGGLNKSVWTAVGAGEAIAPVEVTVEMPETTENVYMEKSCEIVFAINAVQGNTPTVNATVVASDEEVVAAINSDAKEVVLKNGTYELFVKNNIDLGNKNVTFIGTKKTIIDLTGLQIGYVNSLAGATLTFDGMEVDFSGNNEGYQGLKNAKKVVYKNCIIKGTQFLYGDAEFINCTFVTENGYSVWAYGANNVLFSGCTFNTQGRAILVYFDQYTDDWVTNVTAKNCVFNDDGTYVGAKAAIETGDFHTHKYNLVIEKCSTNGFEANKSDSALWGNKNSMGTDRLNVVIDGTDVY